MSFISALMFRRVSCLGSFIFGAAAFANYQDGRWDFHIQGKTHSFLGVQNVLGSPYLNVSELAARFNIRLETSSRQREFVLKKDDRRVSLRGDTAEVQGFWGKARLSRAPQLSEGKWLVPLDFGDRVLRPLLTGVPPSPLFKDTPAFEVDVVLDPGHGGNDFGAIVREGPHTYLEKDIVLLIALELKGQLEQRGLRVGMTRSEDVFLALPERTNFVNRMKPKLFLSLHLNSSPKNTARGYEIFVLSLESGENAEAAAAVAKENMMIPSDLEGSVEKSVAELRARTNLEASLEWAKRLSEALRKKLPPASQKPIRQGPFYVLYGTAMPALLMELAFLNNAQDRALIDSPSDRKTILGPLAESISSHILKESNHKTKRSAQSP